MIWIILTIIITVITISFAASLHKDDGEFKLQTLDKKFKVIVDFLNKELLDNYGKITTIDKRAFNLHYESGKKIIQFMYSTGNLNIIYRHNSPVNEIVCERLFDNLRNASSEKQTLVAEEFLLYVEKKIYALQVLSKDSKVQIEKNNVESTKYKINSMFYSFCFSPEIAKIFLNQNDSKEAIVKGLLFRYFLKETILEGLFKKYIKKQFDFDFGENSSNFYRVDGFKVFIDSRRMFCSEDSYFEILYNDLEDVKNEYSDEVARAEEFILYCKNNYPTAIFILLYDPIIEKYAIRRIYENGTSNKLTFIENNENSDAMDFIKNYIANKQI